MNFADMLTGAIETVESWFTRFMAPAPEPIVSIVPTGASGTELLNAQEAQVAKLIAKSTIALGPLPGTRGVIHRVSSDEGAIEAHLIVKWALFYKIQVALLCAFIRGESDFDPLAVNPNWGSLNILNPTPLQVLLNSDLGVAQISFAVARAQPEFAHMSDEEIRIRVMSLEWGIAWMAATIATNLQSEYDETEVMLAYIAVPDGPWPTKFLTMTDKRRFVAQQNAYNEGVKGTRDAIEGKRTLDYGYGVAKRFLDYLPLVA